MSDFSPEEDLEASRNLETTHKDEFLSINKGRTTISTQELGMGFVRCSKNENLFEIGPDATCGRGRTVRSPILASCRARSRAEECGVENMQLIERHSVLRERGKKHFGEHSV